MKALDAAGLLDVGAPPDDETEALHAHALQQALPFVEATALAVVQPRRHRRHAAAPVASSSTSGPRLESPAPARPVRPRVDWPTLLRHTFGLDVLACPWGGQHER